MPDLSIFDLTGKKALVTGGGTGIGWVCALALAKAGADVAIAARREDVGNEAVMNLKRLGRDAMFVRCDISQPEQVDSMICAVTERFGRLDIAVNNAGIYRAGQDESLPKEQWDEVIGVNLTGTWLCARAEMQQMIKQTPRYGKIINIGSIAASIACSNGAYDASKAAVVHLTRTLAARWGRYNINVNCLSPGYVDFDDRLPEHRQRIIELTPLVRVQRPSDLDGPLLFLASQASDYVTGQNLTVDGGHTLSPWFLLPGQGTGADQPENEPAS